jgi:predicted transcriptional regulator
VVEKKMAVESTETQTYGNRDPLGRFTSVDDKDKKQIKRENDFNFRLREIERRRKKSVHMLWFESKLLYILVDNFEKPYNPDLDIYKFYDIRRFKRKKYHDVLMDHPICRNRLSPSFKTPGLVQPSNVASASFCTLIKRLEQKGWIRRIKDGKKLYLKITEDGLAKIRAHYEYYNLGLI